MAKARPLRFFRSAVPLPAGFAVDFLPDGAAIKHAPVPWAARSTLYVLALLVAVVVWAAVSPVDRVVTASGRLITIAPTIVAQPLGTAIIRSIEVAVGDVVRVGDRLATLDSTFAAADLADLAARLLSLDAQIGRLWAELDGGEFRPAADSPDARMQGSILERRRAEYRARLTALDEKAAQFQAALATSQRAQAGLAERLALIEEVEAIRLQSQQRQTGSLLTLLEARGERLRVRDDLAALQDRAREAAGHEWKVLQAERSVFIDEWRRKATEELVEQTRQRATLVEQIAKAERRRALVTLVPSDVPLEVEADISSRDAGLVRIGDVVRVKLDAFPFQRHGALPGEVRTISADAFPREAKDGGGAVFRAWVRLLAARPDGVPERTRLSPGMVASAEIRVGTRSVLSYFLYPVIRLLDESIREP